MYDDKLHEECGVFGVYSSGDKDVASLTYYGLYALQHRGQESAGIVVSDGKKQKIIKGLGLVSEVFNNENLKTLDGKNAVGHVRYSTAGASTLNNSQPIHAISKYGEISVAHNGNLVNADVIKDLLVDAGVVFQTSIDSEVILNLIARNIKYGLEKGIQDAVHAIKGSYAIIMLIGDKLIGVRDPNGIRPLCIGKKDDAWFLSSESCAFDAVGADFFRDVGPGEIVIIDSEGIKSINDSEKIKSETCSFEYIYFSRPDSIIDGINVYKFREISGEILFQENPVEADIVTGVPDSGIAAAVGYSKASGIPYGITLIKNKYIGRTFIAPSQELRNKAVQVKLNALKSNVEGKRVVLVDDSIVRGTTSKQLVNILRRAGAKEVHLRISSPPVKYPCYFGIDTPHRSQLIASKNSIEEISEEIGADSVGFLSVKGILKAFGNGNNYCFGCFKGIYPLPAPMEKDKFYLEENKNEEL